MAGVVASYDKYLTLVERLSEAEDLMRDGAEEDLKQLAQEEVSVIEPELDSVLVSLHEFLRPRDPNDDRESCTFADL